MIELRVRSRHASTNREHISEGEFHLPFADGIEVLVGRLCLTLTLREPVSYVLALRPHWLREVSWVDGYGDGPC